MQVYKIMNNVEKSGEIFFSSPFPTTLEFRDKKLMDNRFKIDKG